jgi:hypothetical protein
MRQHDEVSALPSGRASAFDPLANVASIAAKASAVIEIVTMRLMWSCHIPKQKTPRR